MEVFRLFPVQLWCSAGLFEMFLASTTTRRKMNNIFILFFLLQTLKFVPSFCLLFFCSASFLWFENLNSNWSFITWTSALCHSDYGLMVWRFEFKSKNELLRSEKTGKGNNGRNKHFDWDYGMMAVCLISVLFHKFSGICTDWWWSTVRELTNPCWPIIQSWRWNVERFEWV